MAYVLTEPQSLNIELWRKRISYWREYPDVFYAQIQSPDSPYTPLVFQDLYLRIMANYKDTYIDATRGSTKTFTNLRYEIHRCIFYPGVMETIVAPTKEQGVDIIKECLDSILKCYPILQKEFTITRETRDELILTFQNGSKLRTAAATNTSRGGNDTDISVEEFAQKEFNHVTFNAAFVPRVRLWRRVRGERDQFGLYLKKNYITSCASQQNPAYAVYKQTKRKMVEGKSAYVIGNSWRIPVLAGLLPYDDLKERRGNMTHLAFQQEYESVWTGTSVNSIVKDEVLQRSRKLKFAEFEHCGDADCMYILAVDIARESGQFNAKTAMSIIKIMPITDKDRTENYSKYWKDIVYLQSFEGVDHTTQAKIIKELANRFQPYVVVIDANSYGMAIRDELMRDLDDGFPPYGVINDERQDHLRQPGAVDLLYALKSNTTEDPDKDMITYAEVEFENGRVRLLCDCQTGLKEYKRKYRIKDDDQDNEILAPYILTDELCDEISNLVKLTEGHSIKEKRISEAIPRDKWSSLKYGLRMAQYKELELMEENSGNAWGERFENKLPQNLQIEKSKKPTVVKRSNGAVRVFS